MTEDRSNAIMLGTLGMLSGAAAWVLTYFSGLHRSGFRFGWTLSIGFDQLELTPRSLFPGLIFGLVIGILLRRRGKVGGLQQAGYLAAAGLSYLCAFHAAVDFYFILLRLSPDFLRSVMIFPDADFAMCGIVACLVDSVLLGGMSKLLFRVPARLVLGWPIVVSGSAGALLGFSGPYLYSGSAWRVLAFVTLWKGAYAASLAPLLRLQGSPNRLEKTAMKGVRSTVLTGAMLVFAMLAVAEPAAQAMAPKPEPEDMANAAALMAAPWLICNLGPDSAAGLPDGVKWNWERAQFEVNDGSPYVDKFVIRFDDEKRRAKLLGEKEGKFIPFPTSLFVHPSANSSPTMAISIGIGPQSDDAFVISRRRTASGGFLGIVKSTVRFRFVSDPEVGLVPMSCAPAADDTRTQQIERARAEWLAMPTENQGTQQ